jgi:hypothetical protein
LGHLLTSDGHKLVKKKRKFRPKSARDRPLFDQSRYFKFVWWAVSFAQGNSNLKAIRGFLKTAHTKNRILIMMEYSVVTPFDKPGGRFVGLVQNKAACTCIGTHTGGRER